DGTGFPQRHHRCFHQSPGALRRRVRLARTIRQSGRTTAVEAGTPFVAGLATNVEAPAQRGKVYVRLAGQENKFVSLRHKILDIPTHALGATLPGHELPSVTYVPEHL